MSIPRRTLLSLLPVLPAAARGAAAPATEYFPPPDAAGGWRTLDRPADVQKRTGIDVSRLDQAFQYVQTTSAHGGLLVACHGYLVYEKYFGQGNRQANPNLYSVSKMFTSTACGIMLAEDSHRLPQGLDQAVFTQEYLPEAYPLDDPKLAGIKLGNLLTMTSGIQAAQHVRPGAPPPAATKHLTAIVRGENVSLPIWFSSDSPTGQDESALHGIRMWTTPGAGYLYSRDPHIGSIVLRRVVGMELQEYLRRKLAEPMGWGRWGYALHTPQGDLPHTPGESSIALHSTDALRFAYLLLRNGRWQSQQLVPAQYLALCRQPSRFNPHSPFSLQFEVNADGHVAGAPRDTFFKSGAGGFGLYIIPSLDLVIYKMSSLNAETYDPSATGLPLTYAVDHSRDGWKPHPFNQFVEGPVEGDTGVRRTLEMVVASVCSS
ncbi:MAG TPA: serine hydrolase [Bryobacteraceae bacterium]|jgi:CubicO group peptidase (beta-lactamase class C family)|nr:serine hydrolase [Bryobacteraceae bacterium]